jgi:hypothetical protein
MKFDKGRRRIMTREQIYEFFSRFDGPEGCSTRSICMLSSVHLRVRDANGSMTWECPGDRSKTLSRQILTSMGIKVKEQIRFLTLLDMYEGDCECEILCNILEEKEGVKNFADDYLGVKGEN